MCPVPNPAIQDLPEDPHRPYLDIVERAPFGIYVVDQQFRLIGISEGAKGVFAAVPEPIGKDFAEVLGAIWQEPFLSDALSRFRHTLKTGEDFRAPHTVEVRQGSGDTEAYDWMLRRIRMPDGKWAVVCYFYDMTERQREQDELRKAREREVFLLRLSDGLRPLSDPETIKSEAMRILGEHLGVRVAQYYDVEPNDEWLVPTGGFTNGTAPVVGRLRIDDLGAQVKEAFRAGRPLAVNDRLTDPQVPDTHKAAYEQHQVRAFIGVPLHRHGRFAVLIGLHQETPRSWTENEIALVGDVAQRIWATVERARVEGELRALETRNTFLLKLSDALQPLSETNAIQETAARLLGTHLGAARVRYVMVAEDEDLLIAGPCYANGLATITQDLRLSGFDPSALTLYHAGRTFVCDDMWRDREGPTLDTVRALGLRAAVGVPLVRQGRLIGVLGVHHKVPHEWTAAEIDLIEHTAARTWDAVDRARSERALTRSEEKYRSLFNSIDEGFCTIEVTFDEQGEATDYVFLTANPAFERQSGWGDVVGRSMREMAPDHEAFWYRAYGRIARDRQPLRFEHHAAALGRTFEVYAFPVGCPGQRQVGVLFTDITKRKAVEKRLRESEAQFRAYVTASSDAIFRMNADCSELQQLVGRSFVADHGTPTRSWLYRYIHRDDRPHVIATGREALRAGIPFSLEHRVIRADGRPGWSVSRAVPLTDEQGKVIAWFGAATDVTERKEAEEALREAQERYQAFMRHSAEGIWRCEVEVPMPLDLPVGAMIDHAYAHGYLAECNDAMARMYGHDGARDLQGARLGDLLPRTPENVAFLTAFFTNGFKATGGESVELHHDGHAMHFSNNLVGIVENGHVVRVWGTQSDITQRKHAEAELRRTNHELERFNRVAVGRELRMVELKRDINALCRQLGLPERFPLDLQRSPHGR